MSMLVFYGSKNRSICLLQLCRVMHHVTGRLPSSDFQTGGQGKGIALIITYQKRDQRNKAPACFDSAK